MAQLVALQAGLTIASPIPASIKKAYTYFPPASVANPDCPCFMNSWTMTDEVRDGGMRWQHYTVHMQLFVDNADKDVAADIAAGFHVALVDALDISTSLGGTVAMQIIRGGSPTLAVLERSGQAYMGLDLYLDLTLKEGKAFAP